MRILRLILVDDASTDLTWAKCEEFAEIDGRIHAFHLSENRGPDYARRYGVEHCAGEYLSFIDSDDTVEKEYCEILLKAFQGKEKEGKSICFVSADYLCDGVEKRQIYSGDVKLEDMETRVKLVANFLFDEVFFVSASLWNKLYRTEWVRDTYANIPKYFRGPEDLIFFIYWALGGEPVYLIRDVIYHYSVREESISHIKSIKQITELSWFYKGVMEVLQSRSGLFGPEYIDELKHIFNSYLIRYMIAHARKLADPNYILQRYYYTEWQSLCGKTIILYGAGVVGRDYYAQLSRISKIRIAAWVDRDNERYSYDYRQVDAIDKIHTTQFDTILIAVSDQALAERIEKDLKERGITQPMLWSEPEQIGFDRGDF